MARANRIPICNLDCRQLAPSRNLLIESAGEIRREMDNYKNRCREIPRQVVHNLFQWPEASCRTADNDDVSAGQSSPFL
jgi:hypothetical protein